MTPRKILVGCTFSLIVAALAGCDDDKKTELQSKTSASADAAPPPLTSAQIAQMLADSGLPPPTTSVTKEGAPRDCQPGPGVTIADPDFDTDVHLKLKKEPGTPLTYADLAQVKSLNLTRKKAKLEEIDPCLVPKMTGLKELFLPPGTYRDLKPIANLIKLESLRASISEVENIQPLEKLVQLDRLDLGRTSVRDISVLANLVNLTELSLDDTQVSDISPLAKCKKLEKVSIKHTNVQDVSPLKDLPKLKFVYVEGAQINNLDTLAAARGRGLKVETK